MPTLKQAHVIAAALSIALAAPTVQSAETAYLRPGDVIVCVGDSVTHAGVYDGFLQTMLDRLYPEAGIRIVNRGQGGQSSSAALAAEPAAGKNAPPAPT